MPWNLFETQPLLLYNPTNDTIACAAVSPIQGGIVWWNADYLLCQGQTGMPGSGFGANPVEGVLDFNDAADVWRIADPKTGSVYAFEKADVEMLQKWDDLKHFVAPIDELHKIAAKDYNGLFK